MRTRLAFALAVVAACGGDDTSSGPDATTGPDAATVHAFVPTPTGTCPTFAAGDVNVAPTGITPRRVKVAMNASATPGPLILYWHATGSNTNEAASALGATLTAMVNAGAVVVSPASDPAAGQFPWYLVNQSTRQDDFLVADEIVGCLAAAGRINTDRVHSMGMSAGALQSTGMTFLRSSYTASSPPTPAACRRSSRRRRSIPTTSPPRSSSTAARATPSSASTSRTPASASTPCSPPTATTPRCATMAAATPSPSTPPRPSRSSSPTIPTAPGRRRTPPAACRRASPATARRERGGAARYSRAMGVTFAVDDVVPARDRLATRRLIELAGEALASAAIPISR